MKKRQVVTAGLAMLLAAAPAFAGRLIAIVSQGAVFELDQDSGEATQLGELDWPGTSHIGSTLAYDSTDDILYLLGNGHAYTIDPNTWSVTSTTNVNVNPAGIAYKPATDTMFYVSSGHDPLFGTLDMDTYNRTWLGYAEITAGPLSADTDYARLEYIPEVNTLLMLTAYGTTEGDQQALYRIDQETGLAFRLHWEYEHRIAGDMAYDPERGKLYGLGWYGDFFQIDIRTGETTTLGNLGTAPGTYWARWGPLVYLPDDAGSRHNTAASTSGDSIGTAARSAAETAARSTDGEETAQPAKIEQSDVDKTERWSSPFELSRATNEAD